MRITHTMVYMFIGSFFIQYFLMSPITVNNMIYITHNISKAYLAIIMCLFMVILEVMLHDHQYNVLSVNTYMVLLVLVALFIYLYRKQIAVNDKQYLEAMIEHHSIAIFTSEEILKKTNNYHVTKIAKDIIQKQKDEIHVMNELLK
jgi:hypothetical protein